ncbi:hypothetical protein [Mesorhizobium sp. L-8-3]|uniref:hypothetical protein n=1 Tax=Mesorhizobium sp. L-8-3 TaxID=2744522 RepID=UPI001927FF68|nr:hypothetical protein [Mesorhizobium sp. L-8-3]BCH22832.1 hypothetical protein MesoLjLb_26170 [Mesorhizobium sp. L-8-3]
MARKALLEGIVKWVQRDQRRELFDEFTTQHIENACDEMGIEPEDLIDCLAPVEFSKLWNCVFEDLIAAEIGGSNLADDYLKRRGWKDSAAARTLIRALRQSVMSLYEVTGIRVGEGFFLRDLVRGGEPVWVHEKAGTHNAKELDIFATRLIAINGRTEIGGVTLIFERSRIGAVTDDLRSLANATPEQLETAFIQRAREAGEPIDEEMREAFDVLKHGKAAMSADEVLGRCAFIFTEHWLCQALEKKLGRNRKSAEQASTKTMPTPANTQTEQQEEEAQYDLFGAVEPRKQAGGKRK